MCPGTQPRRRLADRVASAVARGVWVPAGVPGLHRVKRNPTVPEPPVTAVSYVRIWPATYLDNMLSGYTVVGTPVADVLADTPAAGGDLDTEPTTDSTYVEITQQGRSVNTGHGPDREIVWEVAADGSASVVSSLPAGAVIDAGSAKVTLRLYSPVTGSSYPNAISISGITSSGDYPVTAGNNVYEYDVADDVMLTGTGEDHNLAIGEKLGFKVYWVRIWATYSV